jgi:hypothetical protein
MGFDKMNTYALLFLREVTKKAKSARILFDEIISGGENLSQTDLEEKLKKYISNIYSSVNYVSPLDMVKTASNDDIAILATMIQNDKSSSYYKSLSGGNSDVFEISGGKYIRIGYGVYAKTYEQALSAIKGKKEIEDAKPKAEKKPAKLGILYSSRPEADGKFYVYVKIGSNKSVKLKAFDSKEEIKEFLSISNREQANEELRELLEKKKEVPAYRSNENSPRIGEDYRNGKNIDPDMFHAALPFRGIQFGNWNNNDERQTALNEAYDALTDLGNLTGMTLKDLTLGGSLSIAFGARGKGGKNAAMAHYERGERIINLTKKKGAGSLGHEWFHSFDHALANKLNLNTGMFSGSYFTESLGTPRDADRLEGVAKELFSVGADLYNALRGSDYYKASKDKDGARTSDYWSTTVELFARAFESYSKGVLRDRGERNDYLVNVLDDSELYPSEQDM